MSVKAVAALLNISEQGVRDLLKRGELLGYQVGRRWKVRPEALAAFEAAREARSRAATVARPGGPSEWGDLDPLDDNVFN